VFVDGGKGVSIEVYMSQTKNTEWKFGKILKKGGSVRFSKCTIKLPHFCEYKNLCKRGDSKRLRAV
jgi:hypothetical protein